MKKYLRPLGAALVLALLVGAAYAASEEDSLISLNYLRETFFPRAAQVGEERANELLQESYEKAMDRLKAVHAGRPDGGGGAGQASDTLAPRQWSDGEVLSLPTGSSFLLLEGSAAAAHAGAVVDITAGTELASGGRLTAGHRYLVGEDTAASVTVLSGQALLGVQGEYGLTSGLEKHTPFYDVSRDMWHYAAVNYAYDRGLVSGSDSHHFAPDGVMDRASLVMILYRLAGSPPQSGSAAFADVPAGEWYSGAVAWAAGQGVTSGVGGNSFAPFVYVTREQAVGMLYNYTTKYLKRDAGAGADLSAFPDVGKVSDWARTPMAWAVKQGIINGSIVNGAVTLAPQREAFRAEMAAMLQSFCEKIF